jgi:hypothetical protein
MGGTQSLFFSSRTFPDVSFVVVVVVVVSALYFVFFFVHILQDFPREHFFMTRDILVSKRQKMATMELPADIDLTRAPTLSSLQVHIPFVLDEEVLFFFFFCCRNQTFSFFRVFALSINSHLCIRHARRNYTSRT